MPATQALATAGVLQEPATLSGQSLPSMITVERHGPLLVLTYGSKSAGGGLMSNVDSRSEPPGFVVYQGQRPIATGKFEFG